MAISISTLFYAMKLPQLRNDFQRSFEVEQMFMVLTNNVIVEEDTRRKVEELLYCPKVPDTTALEVANHILRPLQECCYRWRKFNDTDLLRWEHWTTPEAGELQIYRAYWGMGSHDVQLSPKMENCSDIDGHLFSQGQLRCKCTRYGRGLRDAVSHRDNNKDWHICCYVQSGFLLALFLDDRDNASKIETIAE